MTDTLPAFKVSMENGDSYVTSMAKGITLEKAKDYFLYDLCFYTYSDESRSRIVSVEEA